MLTIWVKTKEQTIIPPDSYTGITDSNGITWKRGRQVTVLAKLLDPYGVTTL